MSFNVVEGYSELCWSVKNEKNNCKYENVIVALIHFFLNKLGESHTIQRSNCNFLYEPTHTRLTQDTEKGLDFS